MKQTVSQYDFAEAFRAIRPNNFTYAGLNALFEYLEQCEEECDTEIELDVIAICCDFFQYTDKELQSTYPDIAETLDDPADLDEWIEYLQDEITVIPVTSDSVIIQDF